MKAKRVTTASNIELPEGKNENILFGVRLIANGLFKPGANLPSGFGLRLRRASDGRTLRNWIFQYRQHGRSPRMGIASADSVTAAQALERARKLHAEVELGGDPQGNKQERRNKDAQSLRFVMSHQEDEKAGDPGGFLENKTDVKEATKRMLESYLLGPLGFRAKGQGMKPYLHGLHSTPIDKITRADISARLLAVSKANGVPTAIALRSALSSLYSWAMQMGYVDSSPLVDAFIPEKPDSRDRVLSSMELAAIWNTLDDDGDYAKAIKLLILTGCRRQEIDNMRWSEFAPDMSIWTLPKERSKTGKSHTLPVTPMMREIIESVPKRDGYDFLFGRKHGFTGWSIGKPMLDKKLGLKSWVTHDIRRSVATGMNDIGVQPHIVEEILNHQSGHRRGVAGIYNKSPYEREVRAAMAMWSDHVRALIEGTDQNNVVPMRGR
jgi:integrase